MIPLLEVLEQLASGWGLPGWLPVLLAASVPAAVAAAVALVMAGFSTYVERKLAADIQRRVGANQCNVDSFFGAFAREVAERSGLPNAGLLARMFGLVCRICLPLLILTDRLLKKFLPGVLIFLADGLKLMVKEDLIPALADRPLFKLAPVVVLGSCLAALAGLPFSDRFYVADLNLGLFYLAAITSLEVIGILVAGWASHNKWSLLGGLRASAQIVSYEIPAGLALLTVILLSGHFSMQKIILDQFGAANWQQGWIWQWNLFASPFLLVLAPVYFIAGLAECNRTPFDLPEAESELVAGFHTEYSGIRFGFFNMAEYIMMFIVSAIAATVFLGGWSTGLGWLETQVFALQPGAPEAGFHWWASLIHLAVFCGKTFALLVLMIWIRWTLPRFRVDQLMALCWKKLLPIGLAAFTGAAVWVATRPLLVNRLAAGRTRSEAEALLNQGCGLGALCVFLGLTAWLGWFFLRPLSVEDQRRRRLIADENLAAEVARRLM